jgi:predicted solute-binding protein
LEKYKFKDEYLHNLKLSEMEEHCCIDCARYSSEKADEDDFLDYYHVCNFNLGLDDRRNIEIAVKHAYSEHLCPFFLEHVYKVKRARE